MVYGVKSGREIQEDEGCDRPFSKNDIILSTQMGTFSGTIFSVS